MKIDPRLDTGEAVDYSTKYATGQMKTLEDGIFRVRCVMAFSASLGAFLYNTLAYAISYIANHQFGQKNWSSSELDYDRRSDKNWADVKAYGTAICNPKSGLIKLGGAEGTNLAAKVNNGLTKLGHKIFG